MDKHEYWWPDRPTMKAMREEFPEYYAHSEAERKQKRLKRQYKLAFMAGWQAAYKGRERNDHPYKRPSPVKHGNGLPHRAIAAWQRGWDAYWREQQNS